jgi:hypothetical protein
MMYPAMLKLDCSSCCWICTRMDTSSRERTTHCCCNSIILQPMYSYGVGLGVPCRGKSGAECG